MQQVLYSSFSKDSPIQLQKLPDEEYQQIPMLNQVKYLTHLINRAGEIKLTGKGFLPTKMVADIYQQGFIKDELIESGINKLYKETDSMAINLTRILAELAGLTKKRNGKLSLTKSSEKYRSNNDKLLRLLLTTFATKFNWAYYDGYQENGIGQFGFGFTLILLSKYGDNKQPDSFYAEKYFNAFPQLLEGVQPNYGTLEKYTANCYSIRTFDRFLEYFGLVRIDKERKLGDSIKYISKSGLFDRIVHVVLK
jgi:hypothetical protein